MRIYRGSDYGYKDYQDISTVETFFENVNQWLKADHHTLWDGVSNNIDMPVLTRLGLLWMHEPFGGFPRRYQDSVNMMERMEQEDIT